MYETEHVIARLEPETEEYGHNSKQVRRASAQYVHRLCEWAVSLINIAVKFHERLRQRRQ